IRHVERGRVDGDTIVAETGLQAELEIAERLRAERYPRRRGRTRGRSAAAITLLIGAVDDGLVEQTVGKTEQPVDVRGICADRARVLEAAARSSRPIEPLLNDPLVVVACPQPERERQPVRERRLRIEEQRRV